MAREISSKNIEGIADLVVCAPIKQGFIDAFENVTYETRLRLATETFHKIHVDAREYELVKPFTDVIERIQSLLAFRVGILNTSPQPSLILAATFDRAWEPYMRLIWNPLGAFLDVLFCNCEGYVSASDHVFPEYARWVRAHQVDSTLFYATTPLTVGDQLYLSRLEQLQRTGGSEGDDRALAALTAADPEALARGVRQAAARTHSHEQQRFLTMAVEALVALYRLADYYPPDDLAKDGKYLLRAAKYLFEGWDTRGEDFPKGFRESYAEMFEWLETTPPLRTAEEKRSLDDQCEVQAGILSGYNPAGPPIKHGCLLMFGVGQGVGDAAKARTFIEHHLHRVSWEGEPSEDGVFLNVAITCRGLASLGVSAETIREFPKEFREGMEDRAGLIGDVRENHPRRWRLPARFGHAPPQTMLAPVEMSEIDVVVQLRTAAEPWGYIPLPNTAAGLGPGAGQHPLAPAILEMLGEANAAGMTLLSIQPMRRIPVETGSESPSGMRDHFDFLDFVSQPSPRFSAKALERDKVALGELLLGYANDRGDPVPTFDSLLNNGSFLVIRKMSQQVEKLNKFLADPEGAHAALKGDDLAAKMMGRRRDGVPLALDRAGVPLISPTDNDFEYTSDPAGEHCPFQAHIRRANPRIAKDDRLQFGRPTPRIMRRGMSYGPTVNEDSKSHDRGVVFMAYNASIAEQFEVIQRWINGGNSTGVAAAQNDPLIGVRPATGPKTFRFAHGSEVVRVDIPGPFVDLEWGLYLFVPSKTALRQIAKRGAAIWPTLGDAEKGEAIIQRLLALPEGAAPLAWKTYLEDFSAKDPAERCDTPDVWAAIRENHAGALHIPGAVLAASGDLIEKVLMDEGQNYTVRGEAERMEKSLGVIYVGLDPGDRYDHESRETNGFLMAVGREEAFTVARDMATRVLQALFGAAKGFSTPPDAIYPVEIDLGRNFITPTLGLICNYWFGIPATPKPERPPFIGSGGWNWTSLAHRAPVCPGDFLAPSRYCFYPDPTKAITRYGQAHGQALRKATRGYFDGLRPPEGGGAGRPDGKLTQQMFDAIGDNDLLARTLIGVMIGALPPIDGNLRSVLYDWLKEKTFWRRQQALLASGEDPFDWAKKRLEEPMRRAMQKRPAPDLLWRTAVKPHRLGKIDVKNGDKIILAIGSATLEKYNEEQTTDVSAVFGGVRTPDSPHPVHACPAYEMAIGTMLGVLTALFEVGQIESLPAPLLVRLTRAGAPSAAGGGAAAAEPAAN